MRDKLKELRDQALEALRASSAGDEIAGVKQRYLGRKGPFASLIKDIAGMPPQERREAGEAVNSVKREVEDAAERLMAEYGARERHERLRTETIDVTLPARPPLTGSLHPVTRVMDEVEGFFLSLGFDVAEGPEVELDYYNFEALNMPPDHPARDMQDTFYIGADVLLRTHTSPVQIRVMEKKKPPLRVIAPGTVYRRDSDITHTPMFHQVEGFMVGESVTFGELKGVLNAFLKNIFGEATQTRFRPSFFPFTEPSAEVDIRCVMCAGDGCRVCRQSGWLEILGCGMIHPQVLRAVDYDPEMFTGFAFGLGIERITMLKYGIDDIRLFFENDLRFLRQF